MDADKIVKFMNTQQGKDIMNDVSESFDRVIKPYMSANDQKRTCACLFKIAQLGELAKSTLAPHGILIEVVEDEKEKEDK